MHQEDPQRSLWVRMRVLGLYVTLCTVLVDAQGDIWDAPGGPTEVPVGEDEGARAVCDTVYCTCRCTRRHMGCTTRTRKGSCG